MSEPLMTFLKKTCILFLVLANGPGMHAQPDSLPVGSQITVVAGADHEASALHKWLFGHNRRSEWLTPVRVPVVYLNSIYGGLVPYEKGGGGESRSLKLRSKTGREYALRSIYKTRDKGLPRLLRHTFYASLVQDGVSMSHPYGALALPVMLQATNIYHTRPMLVYLPQQVALDSFNQVFANDLYLLEERPADPLSDMDDQKFYNTAEVKEKVLSDGYKADQYGFLKARLFDILISDVDRHEGNWKWRLYEKGKTFQALPVDRDQAFFTHDGLLTPLTIPLTRRRRMQSFDMRIRNVYRLTNHDLALDKFFTSELSHDDWQRAANELQNALTDSVINRSIRQLPPEIMAISGNELIGKLMQRRNDLDEYAARYYRVLAGKVNVNGTREKEYFEVKKMAGDTLSVRIYPIDSKGNKSPVPSYQRFFPASETKRIILQGHGGGDVFNIEDGKSGIRLRRG